jgi:glyoxylase-like metal-dependent hydrolase (beta-lactamase superfamily II)
MMDGMQASFRHINHASQNGFSDSEVEFVRRNPRYTSAGRDGYNFHFLKQGDFLSYGDFKFTCIETPGHSPGHMCLYDAGKKILLSGDHILIDISPNVSCWSGGENPLADYLKSLDKLYNFEVSIVLPGHRRTFSDLAGRIDELKHHHEKRAAETLTVLKRYETQNAYQVASHLTWRVPYGSWEAFPIWQKFSAVGETLAHLNYLESLGEVNRENGGARMVFSLK